MTLEDALMVIAVPTTLVGGVIGWKYSDHFISISQRVRLSSFQLFVEKIKLTFGGLCIGFAIPIGILSMLPSQHKPHAPVLDQKAVSTAPLDSSEPATSTETTQPGIRDGSRDEVNSNHPQVTLEDDPVLTSVTPYLNEAERVMLKHDRAELHRTIVRDCDPTDTPDNFTRCQEIVERPYHLKYQAIIEERSQNATPPDSSNAMNAEPSYEQ